MHAGQSAIIPPPMICARLSRSHSLLQKGVPSWRAFAPTSQALLQPLTASRPGDLSYLLEGTPLQGDALARDRLLSFLNDATLPTEKPSSSLSCPESPQYESLVSCLSDGDDDDDYFESLKKPKSGGDPQRLPSCSHQKEATTNVKNLPDVVRVFRRVNGSYSSNNSKEDQKHSREWKSVETLDVKREKKPSKSKLDDNIYEDPCTLLKGMHPKESSKTFQVHKKSGNSAKSNERFREEAKKRSSRSDNQSLPRNKSGSPQGESVIYQEIDSLVSKSPVERSSKETNKQAGNSVFRCRSSEELQVPSSKTNKFAPQEKLRKRTLSSHTFSIPKKESKLVNDPDFLPLTVILPESKEYPRKAYPKRLPSIPHVQNKATQVCLDPPRLSRQVKHVSQTSDHSNSHDAEVSTEKTLQHFQDENITIESNNNTTNIIVYHGSSPVKSGDNGRVIIQVGGKLEAAVTTSNKDASMKEYGGSMSSLTKQIRSSSVTSADKTVQKIKESVKPVSLTSSESLKGQCRSFQVAPSMCLTLNPDISTLTIKTDNSSSLNELSSTLSTNPDSFVYIYEPKSSKTLVTSAVTTCPVPDYTINSCGGSLGETNSSFSGTSGDLSSRSTDSDPSSRPSNMMVDSRGYLKIDYSPSWKDLNGVVPLVPSRKFLSAPSLLFAYRNYFEAKKASAL